MSAPLRRSASDGVGSTQSQAPQVAKSFLTSVLAHTVSHNRVLIKAAAAASASAAAAAAAAATSASPPAEPAVAMDWNAERRATARARVGVKQPQAMGAARLLSLGLAAVRGTPPPSLSQPSPPPAKATARAAKRPRDSELSTTSGTTDSEAPQPKKPAPSPDEQRKLARLQRFEAGAAPSPSPPAAAVSLTASSAAGASSRAPVVAPSTLPHSIVSLPTVSYHCLQRAQKTIQDVVQTYLFIFHADTPASATTPVSTHPSPAALQLMFRLLPLLTFVSGTIYQLDEENEERNARRRDQIEQGESVLDEDSDLVAGVDTDKQSAYDVLVAILKSLDLLTPRVQTELQKGRLYWQLERELCDQLTRGLPLRLSDVHTASQCKSFDYRVLHLLIYASRDLPPDDAVLTALQWNEQLVDLHDDLVDYEDDVTTNAFNLYRMYVRLYADQAPVRLTTRIRTLEAKFAEAMLAVPPQMRARFEARESEAMREYGREGQDGSRWVIPQPILDEATYRRECAEAEAQSRALAASDTA